MTIRRVAAATIALIAWIGLAVQFGATIATFKTVPATLSIMSLYFTILANLAVAILFTAVVARPGLVSPFLIGGITIAMLLVGIVYNTLLRGMVDLSGGAELANRLNHMVTPITVSVFWLFLAEKGRLRWSAPLKWAALPLVYFVYGLSRGALEGTYPYPFMNAPLIGWGQTLANAAVMAMGFVILGYAMVWLDHRAAPLRD